MRFKEIAKTKIKKGDYLWRYIDLHKLIDLGTSRQIHFTRADYFKDPFEGITYDLLARRYSAKLPKATNPAIPKELRENINNGKEQTLKDYEVESLNRQKTQFINCWLRSQRESVAMWDLYSNRDSVAIRGDARELIDYFKQNLELQPHYYPKYEFIAGSITYMWLNPVDLHKNFKVTLPRYSSFKKDVAFDHEKEFRFLIATPSDNAESNPNFLRHDLTQNFFDLIQVVSHPEMEDWKFENLKRLCVKLKLPKPNKSVTEMRIK